CPAGSRSSGCGLPVVGASMMPGRVALAGEKPIVPFGHFLLQVAVSPAPWRTMMLRNPPVAAAPDKRPRHAIGKQCAAIGEIDMASRDDGICAECPHEWHGIAFHPHAGRTAGKI